VAEHRADVGKIHQDRRRPGSLRLAAFAEGEEGGGLDLGDAIASEQLLNLVECLGLQSAHLLHPADVFPIGGEQAGKGGAAGRINRVSRSSLYSDLLVRSSAALLVSKVLEMGGCPNLRPCTR
jgi:hypothetical protein